MKQTIFTGSCVALITPFHPDGSVNFEKLGELIELHIAHHTDAIAVCATTGEAPTISDEEHLKTLQYAVQRRRAESRSLPEPAVMTRRMPSISANMPKASVQTVFCW